MTKILKHDTDGTKPLLSKGEFGYDDYSSGGDEGRVYIGTGTKNIGMASVDSTSVTRFEITQVAHGLQPLDVVTVDGSGNFVKAIANSIDTLGVSLVTEVVDVDNFIAVQIGNHLVPSHGLTVGSNYYLSDTISGGITTTIPYIPQQVLHVTSSDHIVVSMSMASLYIAPYNTVADIVADTELVIGQKVRTLGYYAPGDGGGNDYEIEAAGTGTHDGGSRIDLVTHQAKGLFNKTYHVAQWGAKQDGVASDTSAVNNAITYVSSVGGGHLDFEAIFAGGGGFVLKTDVVLRGKGIDKSRIASLGGWSGNIAEVDNFSTLEAAGTADTAEGCPVAYGIVDCIVDGSGYDGTVSATQGYCVRLYGRKLILQRIIIGKSKGIGLYTSFPALPSYTFFDPITDTKFSSIKDVQVLETAYEGFVFNGPTDQYLDNVFVGFPAGSRTDVYDTTGAKTSLLFPGEAIHGLRILRSCEMGFVHAFDNEYGYAVYIKRQVGDSPIRLRAKYLMGESSYGCVYVDTDVRGAISLLETHNNSRGPTVGGAYSGSAGANPHFKCESTLGFSVSQHDCYREQNEGGSIGVELTGISIAYTGGIYAYAASFTGGGKGFVNNASSARIVADIASKSGAGTLDIGFEEGDSNLNNLVNVTSRFCDVNFDFLGGAGSDTGSIFNIKTRAAGTTEINNLARLTKESYLQSDILTDDNTNKRRNKFIGSVAVDFSITGLQTLSVPYGTSLVRDPLEGDVQLTVSYDSGTFSPIARLGISNIDTAAKEIDIFIEATGGAAGAGKINVRVG